MTTLSQRLQEARVQLQGSETTALDARLLLQHALGLSAEEMLLQSGRILQDVELQKIHDLIAQRLQGRPVAKIIGVKEFYGRMFFTNEHTLDPRPDSETLIDAVLKDGKPQKILELGVGTGCLLLTLLAEISGVVGTGVDISNDALKVAQRNADALGLADRVTLQQGNWCDGIAAQFDAIISNPPYIPESDRVDLARDVLFDPAGALFAGADGLDAYRALIPQLSPRLAPNGLVALEVGIGQDRDVAELLKTAGFTRVWTASDLGGVVRIVLAKRA